MSKGGITGFINDEGNYSCEHCHASVKLDVEEMMNHVCQTDKDLQKMNLPSFRYKVMFFEPSLLIEILNGLQGRETTISCQGLPHDAGFVRMFLRRDDQHAGGAPIGIVIWSSSFEPVPEGCILPELKVTFTDFAS